MAKHIIYNECYIIKFNNHSYEAFILNADDDVPVFAIGTPKISNRPINDVA